jgi:hypothetical protein
MKTPEKCTKPEFQVKYYDKVYIAGKFLSSKRIASSGHRRLLSSTAKPLEFADFLTTTNLWFADTQVLWEHFILTLPSCALALLCGCLS